jgi:hypothetical protein
MTNLKALTGPRCGSTLITVGNGWGRKKLRSSLATRSG